MAALSELRKADRLVSALERSSDRVVRDLAAAFRVALANPAISRKDLRDIVINHVLKGAGDVAPEMRVFLAESLGLPPDEFIEFAEVDISGLSIEAQQVADRTVNSNSLLYLAAAGLLLTRHVMSQVDQTQDRADKRWRIRVNANACDFCKVNAQEYRGYGDFPRHGSCRCLRVSE